MKSKTKFSHDSLLDRQSTQELLITLANAINKGELAFQESEGELVLSPSSCCKSPCAPVMKAINRRWK